MINPQTYLNNLNLKILGGGAVVTEYYLPALDLLGLISNTIVTDASTKTLSKLKQLSPNIQCEEVDFRNYLNNIYSQGEFDAVVIALPNQFHVEAVELALMKGFHVLCEKPLAMDAASCLKLHELAEKAGKVLAVGMVRRLLPSVTALRNALKNQLIGSLQSIEIECGGAYGWLSESGAFFRKENGGVLADMGVHYLDLIEDLVGSLQPIGYYDDCFGGVEANCEFQLLAQDSIPVKLILSRTHDLKNTAIFKGELGELSLELNTFDTCFWRSSQSDKLAGKLYPHKSFESGDWLPTFNSCFAEQFVEFASAIHEQKTPRVTAKQAANTIGMIEWAYTQRNLLVSPAYSQQAIYLPPSKVVITGGTGFIGEHLIARLVNLGFSDIVVPVRNYKTCAGAARFPIQMPGIDLLDYEQVKASVAGAKFVFHLAYGRDGGNAAQVTIEGTKNVVNAAIESGVECLIILSTMYVFGHPETNQLVDESWPYKPAGGEYGISKAKMELWCLARAKSSPNTRIVVLNPSCVYGPSGKTYTKLPIDLARIGNFCWIEEGKGIANYTYIENLIDAILLAANCEAAHGERFIINDGFCSWHEFITPLIGKFAHNLPSYSRSQLINKSDQTPAGMKDLVRHLIQDLELIDIINRMPILGSIKRQAFKLVPKVHNNLLQEQAQTTSPIMLVKPPYFQHPPVWLADLFSSTITRFSSEKASKTLGWKPLVTLSDGQEKTASFLRSIGYTELL
ncbi:MAG: NAD-dependent epimerase/dehydratase family protein [Nostoc sp.]|uniref:NAD-dependent epimerase/dehydratase family protein n=1 Tax=Nostoc sp. TaxID=1180 RepID=UPI002FFAEA7D